MQSLLALFSMPVQKKAGINQEVGYYSFLSLDEREKHLARRLQKMRLDLDMI